MESNLSSVIPEDRWVSSETTTDVPIRITVQMMSGDIKEATMSSESTVADLHRLICELWEIPYSAQRLISAGEVLPQQAEPSPRLGSFLGKHGTTEATLSLTLVVVAGDQRERLMKPLQDHLRNKGLGINAKDMRLSECLQSLGAHVARGDEDVAQLMCSTILSQDCDDISVDLKLQCLEVLVRVASKDDERIRQMTRNCMQAHAMKRVRITSGILRIAVTLGSLITLKEVDAVLHAMSQQCHQRVLQELVEFLTNFNGLHKDALLPLVELFIGRLPDPGLQEMALFGLLQMMRGSAEVKTLVDIDCVLHCLSSGDQSVVIVARKVMSLFSVLSDNAIVCLIDLLRNSAWWRRLAALRLLIENVSGRNECIALASCALLADEDVDVKMAALECLKAHSTPCDSRIVVAVAACLRNHASLGAQQMGIRQLALQVLVSLFNNSFCKNWLSEEALISLKELRSHSQRLVRETVEGLVGSVVNLSQ